MSFISIQYTEQLRTNSKHLKSGKTIITDAPTDNHGKGEAFSPTDLVATALATCMITVMGIKAQNWEFELNDSTLEVEKIMASNPRRIHKIIITIEIQAINLTVNQKEILIKTALDCPVAQSLNPNLIQQVKFNFK